MMMMVSAINDSNGTIPLSSTSYISNVPYQSGTNETMSPTKKKKKHGNNDSNNQTTTIPKPELNKTTSTSSIIKKRSKPKNNVRFNTDDNIDVLLIDYLYIEHVNELNDDEIQERWFTDEQVEEMDSECKADVYLLENPKSSSSIEIEPRGLEHKTTDGSWNYYTNRKNAANTLLEEIEKQQDEQRFEEEFRLDLDQLAAAYRKVCRIAQKQAYERAYEDYKIARKLYKEYEKSQKKGNSNKKKLVQAENSVPEPSSPDEKVEQVKQDVKSLTVPSMNEKLELESKSKVDDDTTNNEESTFPKSRKLSVSPKKEKKSKKTKATDNVGTGVDDNKNDSNSNGMTVITKRISKKSKKLKDLDEPISTDDEAIPFNDETTAIAKKKTNKSMTPAETCKKEQMIQLLTDIEDSKNQIDKISKTKEQNNKGNDTPIRESHSETTSPNCQDDKKKLEEDRTTQQGKKKSPITTEEENDTTEVSKNSKTKKKKNKIDSDKSVPATEGAETKKSKKKKKAIESCQAIAGEDNDPVESNDSKDNADDQPKYANTKAKANTKIKTTKTKVKEESSKKSKVAVIEGESEPSCCSLGAFLKQDNKKSKKSSKAMSNKDDVSISCSVTTIDFGIMYSKVVRRRRSSKLKNMTPEETTNVDATTNTKCTVENIENADSTKKLIIQAEQQQRHTAIIPDSTSSQCLDVKAIEASSSTNSQTREPVTKRIQRKVSRMYLPAAPPSSSRPHKAVSMDLID